MVPGTWEPEVENALNLGVLSGNWELRGGSLIVWENSQSFMWENARSFMWENTQIKPVYPSKASTTVVCELFGAFELSGGKNEIVAIILRLTPDRHLQHKTSDETYLGHFQSFKYGHAHHNWRWRPDRFPTLLVCFTFSRFCYRLLMGSTAGTFVDLCHCIGSWSLTTWALFSCFRMWTHVVGWWKGFENHWLSSPIPLKASIDRSPLASN